ncbi:MAG: sugar ABC transporter substrate-binding protein [Actinobacteria bacterium]|nr:sugar ABC transporter substrate-binding protein [Actinomycetota bacterium]
MKKSLLWIVVLLLSISMIAVFSLAGCKGKETAAEEEAVAEEEAPAEEVAEEEITEAITLDYWVVQESEQIVNYVTDAKTRYEEENPGVTINFNPIPYEQYRDKLLISIEGGEAPDVFLVDQIWNAEFAASGSIIPLGEYIAEYNMNPEDYFPGAWDSTIYQGEVYGIPSDLDVWSFTFYDKDMFTEAGLDPDNPPILTWEDFAETLEKLTISDKDQWGIALPGGKSEKTICVTDHFIFSNGGGIVSEDGKNCILNSPETIEALEYYKSLSSFAPIGVAAAIAEEDIVLFKNKKVAMFWFPQLGQDNLADADFEWGLDKCPAPEGKESIGTLGGWTMVISEASPNKEEAFKFISFMTSAEINKGVTSLVPANISAAEELLANKVNPELTLEHLMNAKPRPISPIYPQVSEIQQEMIQSIFAGTDVTEAVETASDQIQNILDDFYKQ